MKTGGILSRLTGDVDTTIGLLQMAIMSPAISVIRLVIAVALLLALNWRLALTALAIIPGIMLMSLVFSLRIRPIYRSLRKDVEEIDGRVGETFSGIRVVRACKLAVAMGKPFFVRYPPSHSTDAPPRRTVFAGRVRKRGR